METAMSVRQEASECGSVAERLDRLEAMNRAMGRECRRWRLGAGVVVLGAAVLACGGANKEGRSYRGRWRPRTSC